MITERIISIYPNTVGFGYVVLNEKGEIIDCAIVAINPIHNDKCLKRIYQIIKYYQPNIIIIEDCENSKRCERIKKLVSQINEYENENIKVIKYKKEQVRSTFEVFGARNKFEISRKISEVYTQLQSKLPDKRKTWEPEDYYQAIFDAMALVLTHQYFLD
ncbi:MAG: hypothetical protein A2W90_04870 [Bacteroidetes bacterium GWF2_42_66]|nr:MAG: hypothetical protein A2W89_21090 [Bacteroidetes bacterium GWE2_42_39]OFY40819.1 MAG: hypothetical protein A2W90_04870 [Bacteroidetes bacterium GWF2_42_66]HAZ00587.1 hypothetical protein [Marinilabiliales bacterium]HBL75838.1 hypothetical protein [Prolixibacteraceae bacterium]HCU63087.1 hypothetical protein [Prolixibacteraceae bacterium]